MAHDRIEPPTAPSAAEPEPSLYAWDVPAVRTGGVTDSREAARTRVEEALTGAPAETRGVVRKVELSLGGQPSYIPLGVVASAWRTPTGLILWSDS
jgi:hypothetical protein